MVWQLTPDALDSLMARLDPDPATAGEKYEHLRRALLKFFRWHGAIEPETCTDDTLDRLARRLAAGLTIDDVPTFAHGVARLVRLERVRAAAALPLARDTTLAERLPAPEPEPVDERFDDLQACLDALPRDDRALILRYYAADGAARIAQRAGLARELRISDNALRQRARRVRDQLKLCAQTRPHGSASFDSNNQERR